MGFDNLKETFYLLLKDQHIIMSASSSTSPMTDTPARKRTKKENAPAVTPSGVGIVIFKKPEIGDLEGEEAPGSACIWVMDGDRTRKVPSLWGEWCNEFHASEPHNIYMVPLDESGNFQPLFVTGHIYTKEECGRAMLKHALSKKWVPKCVMDKQASDTFLAHVSTLKTSNNKADKKAIKRFVSERVGAMTGATIQAFIDLCVKYTTKVNMGDENGRPYLLQEVVCGKIERGSTADETAIKEGHEEARIPETFLRTKLQGLGPVEYVTPYGASWSATYKCHVDREVMQRWWNLNGEMRAKKTNWFCAHSWWSFLEGIDKDEMEDLKSKCEMRRGRWESLDTAKSILDAKSLNILQYVLKH